MICPASAEKLDCPLVPESADPTGARPYAYDAPDVDTPIEDLPRVCRSAYSYVLVPVTFLKHIDQYLRGSFEHEDHMMNIRSANERPHASIKRRDMGSFDRDAILMMGRARVSVAFAFVCAITSLREMESILSKYGSVNNLPVTPRLAAARARTATIEAERRRNP